MRDRLNEHPQKADAALAETRADFAQQQRVNHIALNLEARPGAGIHA